MQLPDADVIDGACAELSEKLLSSQRAQVLDHEGPEVEDVVTRHLASLLHHHLDLVRKNVTVRLKALAGYTYS